MLINVSQTIVWTIQKQQHCFLSARIGGFRFLFRATFHAFLEDWGGIINKCNLIFTIWNERCTKSWLIIWIDCHKLFSTRFFGISNIWWNINLNVWQPFIVAGFTARHSFAKYIFTTNTCIYNSVHKSLKIGMGTNIRTFKYSV